MFMSKEFVGYFAKIISDMIEVRHDKHAKRSTYF